MENLAENELRAVNGGSSEGAGYVIGFTIGFLSDSAISIANGSAGRRIGRAIYNVMHKRN